MYRVTTLTTGIWKVMPVFFILIIAITGYNAPESRLFCLFMFCVMIYVFFSSKGRILLSLSTIYLNDETIVIKKNFWKEIEIPIRNAINIEYLLMAQHIIGKFWFYDTISEEKQFVYFGPTIVEAEAITSKLYMACTKAGDLRFEDNA